MPFILEWRHRLLHMRPSLEINGGQSKFHSIFHSTFFQFQNTSSRREDLTATGMGNFQETENIIWLIIWKRDALKENSQGSMIVSCEIMFSVYGCSKTIEMKMFFVKGTILQNKITPLECQNQNTFTTGKIGGSLSKSLGTLQNQWENVLTSIKRCLH